MQPKSWWKAMTPAGRAMLVVAVAAVLSGAALLIVTLGSDDADGVLRIVRSETPPVPAGAPAAPSSVNGDEGELDDLDDFVDTDGEPPDATFARVRIPKLGIDAGVSPRSVEGGVMPVPDGPAGLAWYDMSNWPGLGGRPGGGGNAIFAGHVDYNGTVGYTGEHYRGPAIFFDLHLLSPGDVIEVEHDGEVLRYEVAWVRQLGVSGTDWGEIWSGDVNRDSITLFTCGGTFDFTSRAYSDRLVVRAERV